MIITIYNSSSGEIVRIVTSEDVDPSSLYLSGIEDYILGDYDPKLFYVDISIQQPVLYPTKISEFHSFNFVTKKWEDKRSLEDVKLSKWQYIKSKREEDNIEVLVTPYGSFDADYKSQKGITDAIMLLQTLNALGTPTTVDFTLADNTTTTLNTSQMIEVGLSLGDRTQQLFSKARTLRNAINSASTKEEVEAISW